MINLSFQQTQMMIPQKCSKFQNSICLENGEENNENAQDPFDFLYNNLAQSSAQTNRLICINSFKRLDAQTLTLQDNYFVTSGNKQFESDDQSMANFLNILKNKSALDEFLIDSSKLGQQMGQRSMREIKNLNKRVNDAQKKLDSMCKILKLCFEFLVQILSITRSFQILPTSKFSTVYAKILDYQQSNLRFPQEMTNIFHKNCSQIYQFQLEWIGEKIKKGKIEYFKKMDIINEYKKTDILQTQQIKQNNILLLKRVKELQQKLQIEVKQKQFQQRQRIQIQQKISQIYQYLKSYMRIARNIVNQLENLTGEPILIEYIQQNPVLILKKLQAILTRTVKLQTDYKLVDFGRIDNQQQRQIIILEGDQNIEIIY